MKKLLIITLIAGLGFASCRKSTDGQIDDPLNADVQSITLSEAISRLKSELSETKDKSEQNAPQDISQELKNMSKSDLQSTISSIDLTDPNCPHQPALLGAGTHNFKVNVKRENNVNSGAGRLVSYDFIKGRTYSITFAISIAGGRFEPQIGVQVGLNDKVNPVPPQNCFYPVDLASYGAPFSRITGLTVAVPGTPSFSVAYKTVTLVADKCYSSVWFNFSNLGGMDDVFHQQVSITQLKITDVSASYYTIRGNSLFEGSQENTYDVSFSGLRIGEQFKWSTSGDLRIVGSDVGPTVRVISTNPTNHNGSLTATLPGCQSFTLTRELTRCRTTISHMDSERVSGNGYFSFEIKGTNGQAVPLNEVQSIEWTVSNSNVSTIFTTKEKNYAILNVSGWNPSVNNMLTVNAVVTTICGSIHTFSKQFAGGSGGDLEDS